MGRQAYPIIGGIIGAVVAFIATDGTATWQGYQAGFALGAAIGGIAGSYIDPILIQGNKVGDQKFQVAAEGGARAIMYGRACVQATCVIARGNRKVVNTKTSNGKGSSGSTQNETVHWTFAIGIGEAIPGSSIARIWQDETLVYDILGDSSVSVADNIKFAEKYRFYDGAETQLPDPDLQVFLGEDTPYFRGTAYVVFPNFDLTNTAERVPTFKFEILNGVAGIIVDVETLQWSIPNGTVHTPSQSVTLTGPADELFNIDIFLTGDMEARMYSDPSVTVVGGAGRFITADNSTAVDVGADAWSGFNIYTVTIDSPPQTYYVNAALAGEHVHQHVITDGSDVYKLSIQAAGNATITFAANDVNGGSDFYPQYGTVRADVSGQDSSSGTTISLATVASDIMKRAGMVASEFDVTALDNKIAGVCVENTVSGVEALNAITQPFFIDPCEADGVLKFVKRGAPVVRVLTFDDLTEEPDVRTRENAIEYPGTLDFFYQSPAAGYATTKATSHRYSPQSDSGGEGSVSAPVTFYSSDEPAQIAAKLHKVMWTEAGGSLTWKVTNDCIDLIPTDALGLSLRGVVTRVRIIATEWDGDTIVLSMMADRQSSYTSDVTGIPLPTPTPPLPATMSKSVLAVLDIPPLQDADDSLLYYTACSGETSVWRGAQVQRSLDAGATWSAVGEVTSATTMGRLTATMTAADSSYIDTSNTVTVLLFNTDDEIASLSDTTFLQEQGGIAVALTDGTWEIMQYRDAVDNGAGSWTLSYLQRGRMNTVAGAHAVDALFVVLDTTMLRLAAQTAWLDGDLKHRAVSYGESADDATVVTTTYHGLTEVEWSPASAMAEYDGTYVYVHDIVPRDRFGTEVNPIESINFNGYRITLIHGSDTVTADISAGSNSGHVVSDPLSTVTTVTVAALNKITGPGDAITLTPMSVAAGTLTPEAIVNGGGA
jgi:hypothetical protein